MGCHYVVEAREPVTESDTVFFNMRKIKLQPYRLEFIAANFDNSITGFLEDKYLAYIHANKHGRNNHY